MRSKLSESFSFQGKNVHIRLLTMLLIIFQDIKLFLNMILIPKFFYFPIFYKEMVRNILLILLKKNLVKFKRKLNSNKRFQY